MKDYSEIVEDYYGKYYLNEKNKHHRLIGPAIEWAWGDKTYYINYICYMRFIKNNKLYIYQEILELIPEYEKYIKQNIKDLIQKHNPEIELSYLFTKEQINELPNWIKIFLLFKFSIQIVILFIQNKGMKMKCKSCSEDVPSKFSHSISTNICPFCGGEIMDQELQNSLSSLKNAMKAFDSYKEEILDWFKSNYNLAPQKNQVNIRTQLKPNQLSKFESSDDSNSLENSESNLDESNDQSNVKLLNKQATNEFFKRAGVKDNDYYKKIINKINDLEKVDDKIQVSEEENEHINNPLSTNELLNVLTNGEASSFEDIGSDDNSSIPSFVLNAANNASNKNSNINNKDIEALKRMDQSRIRESLRSGGSVGKIKRL